MCELCFEQNLECILRDLVNENSDLQSTNQDLRSTNQDLQSRLHKEQIQAQQQLREKVNGFKTYLFSYIKYSDF